MDGCTIIHENIYTYIYIYIHFLNMYIYIYIYIFTGMHHMIQCPPLDKFVFSGRRGAYLERSGASYDAFVSPGHLCHLGSA